MRKYQRFIAIALCFVFIGACLATLNLYFVHRPLTASERDTVESYWNRPDEPYRMVRGLVSPTRITLAAADQNEPSVTLTPSSLTIIFAMISGAYFFITQLLLRPMIDRQFRTWTDLMTTQFNKLREDFYEKPDLPQDYPVRQLELDAFIKRSVDTHGQLEQRVNNVMGMLEGERGYHQRIHTNEDAIADLARDLTVIRITLQSLDNAIRSMQDRQGKS